MKKWDRKRSHSWAKSAEGFTLVELIVVIAILGVLSGVGAVGYSGYVKSAAKKADMTLTSQVVRAVETAGNSYMVSFEEDGQDEKGLWKPVGFLVMSHQPLEGEDIYAKVILPEGSADNPLDLAVTAAYGPGYTSALKLQYDAWESGAHASSYAEAENMIDKVDTMGEAVVSFMKELGKIPGMTVGDGRVTYKLWGSILVDEQLLSQDYHSREELVASLADAVAGVERSIFIETWAKLTTEDREDFGLPGREQYAAVRGAYSQCFANYVTAAANHTNYSAHAGEIIGYGEGALELLELPSTAVSSVSTELIFPKAVVGDTYGNDAAKLTSDPEQSDWKLCKECFELWQAYYDSAQARADAGAFYDTMVAGSAYDSGDANAPYAGIQDWAKGQAKIFGDMYTDVEGYGNDRSVIVVAVYEKDGVLDLQVLPAEADARGGTAAE